MTRSNSSLMNSNLFNRLVEYTILAFAFLFLIANTILGKFLFTVVERGEIGLGIILICAAIYYFLKLKPDEKINWIKENSIVICYLVVRVLLIVSLKFDYSTIRSLFFETIFLLAITKKILKNKHSSIKKIMYFTVIFNLIMNLFNVLCYVSLTNDLNIVPYKFIVTKTFYSNLHYVKESILYVNPNSMGIMTGFALIVLAILFFKTKSMLNKVVFSVVIIFDLYCIYLSRCRTVELALVIIFVLYLISRLMNQKNSLKKMTSFILTIAMLGSVAVMIYSGNSGDNLLDLNKFESRFNDISAGRYLIWKSGTMAHSDNYVLGVGSVNREVELREKYIYKNYKDDYGAVYAKLGPHNGYIGMIWCTGVVGALLFFLALLQKIKRAKSLENGNWYLAVIFIFIVNLFETMFIISRFFLVLYLFLILAMDDDSETSAEGSSIENPENIADSDSIKKSIECTQEV